VRQELDLKSDKFWSCQYTTFLRCQSTHNVVPSLLRRDNETLLTVSTAPHGWCCEVLVGVYVCSRSTVCRLQSSWR
jgi:hypothetical protein